MLSGYTGNKGYHHAHKTVYTVTDFNQKNYTVTQVYTILWKAIVVGGDKKNRGMIIKAWARFESRSASICLIKFHFYCSHLP